MTASAEIPKYRLLADHFFEPNMVGKGSIVEYDGEPNHQMEPLNDAAEAALEAWFDYELPVLDEKTGKQVIVDGEKLTHRPRWQLRPPSQRPDAPRPLGLRVLSSPTPTDNMDQSLAAIANQQPKEWARPEAEQLPDVPEEHRRVQSESESGPTGVKVVEAKPAVATTSSGTPNTTTVKA